MKTHKTIVTLWVDEAIQLHLLQPHHTKPLFRLLEANRDHLAPFIGAAEDIGSLLEAQEFIDEGLEDFDRNPAYASFGIFCHDELVGCIGYSRIKSDYAEDRGSSMPEMSFWVARTHEGMGIIRRSAVRVVDYVLIEQQQPLIEVHCAVDNQRSQRVAERLGFIAVPSPFQDVVVYQMSAGAWRERAASRLSAAAAV